MERSILIPILKALLFSSAEPLPIKQIQDVFNRFLQEFPLLEQDALVDESLLEKLQQQRLLRDAIPAMPTAAQLREALSELGARLERAGEVYRLLEGPTGYRLAVIPEFADWVRWMRVQPRPVRLSPTVLETLAIVAYRQPITRAQIEAIRGVSADSAISRLSELNLIAVGSRAELPGRPALYETTPQFLDLVGLTHLSELLSSDVISTRALGEWIGQHERDQQELALGDEALGLPQ